MKKLAFLTWSIFCFFLPMVAQETSTEIPSSKGIQFEDLSLKDALAKAQAEGKKVFVDCYTQTCGPCKYMMKNIFPLEECGDYFNPRYVSLTRDMNVGEGPEMGKKYGVGIYPTFLIINPDGTLYCKEIGAVRLNSQITFVEKMKRAVERTELEKRYDAGERNDSLIRRYAELLKASGSPKSAQVIDNYLAPMSIEKLCEDNHWKLFDTEVTSPDSPAFRKLFDNRKSFENILGKEVVENKLISTYKNEFDMYKMMDMDFAKRITDLKSLEKENLSQASTLVECMTIRWIINEKLAQRISEIITILQQLKSLPSDADRMAIIKELNSFERVASATQRLKACQALRAIQKEMSESYAQETSWVITRISPNK